ncbi:MAG: pilus assembly protein PilM, partial [Thermodesulfovibrionia bacterium]|nr:pilus assembly protein PilM [Thermodesulfovibrionia bacterium]
MTTISAKSHAPFIGVEFKDDTIVVACLKNDFSGINVLSSSTFPLGEEDITISEINSFISQYVSPASNVFVSIPYQWSMVKFIEVPSPQGKGKDAFMNMMKFEIEKHIPFEVEDVFYDLQVIQKKETLYTVMFTAVKREKIEYVNGILDKLALNPQIVTLSPFALLNSIEYSGIPVGGWQETLGVTRKSDIFGRKDEFCITVLMNANEAYIA